jgi:hypothetical protein
MGVTKMSLARWLYEQEPWRYTGWQNAPQEKYREKARAIRRFLREASTLTRHTPNRHTQPSHSVRKSKKPR